MSLSASKISLFSLPLALLVMLAMITGYVPYPVRKQLQPYTTAIILDEENNAIERAQASLIASSYPDDIQQGLELKLTNSQGLVQFEAKQEWRMEKGPARPEIFFWNWCVYKPGYETYWTNYRSADQWQDFFTVNLTPGIAKDCN